MSRLLSNVLSPAFREAPVGDLPEAHTHIAVSARGTLPIISAPLDDQAAEVLLRRRMREARAQSARCRGKLDDGYILVMHGHRVDGIIERVRCLHRCTVKVPMT